MTAPLLSIRGLVKHFGGLLAIDGLDLSVAAGEIHAIIGPNGAGKSTLIGEISGELSPDAGVIEFAGADIAHEPVYRRALRGLARSYQITQIFQEFSVIENVAMAVQAHAGHSFRFLRPTATQRALTAPALQILERVDLARRADHPVATLGHGEQRQLELAMALAGEPKLLLLDEPTAGMSQHESEGIVSLLAALKGQCAMLLVEHDMDAVFALADRITVMLAGRPLVTGSAAQIRADAAVRSAYLGDPDEGI